jgi:hypothetical protein
VIYPTKFDILKGVASSDHACLRVIDGAELHSDGAMVFVVRIPTGSLQFQGGIYGSLNMPSCSTDKIHQLTLKVLAQLQKFADLNLDLSNARIFV